MSIRVELGRESILLQQRVEVRRILFVAEQIAKPRVLFNNDDDVTKDRMAWLGLHCCRPRLANRQSPDEYERDSAKFAKHAMDPSARTTRSHCTQVRSSRGIPVGAPPCHLGVVHRW